MPENILVPIYAGREAETEQLLELKRKKTPSMVVCKGRRRIGKSTFVRRCAEHFDHFFAFEGLAPREGLRRKHQLDAFTSQLAGRSKVPKVSVSDWPAAFRLLDAAIPVAGSTLVLFDEISWMSIGDRDFAGHL